MAEIIKTEGLTKIFNDDVKAVDHISFAVEEGEIFGFLGPNGAGKTTTINMLTTLLKPTEGRAFVDGLDVMEEASKVRKLIGLVPQELTVDDELTGRENILLQAKLYQVPSYIARERITELFNLIGLADAADRYVKTYSGGMRKRLELAEGLVHRPKLLFLDEPTLGLDVQTRTVMWEYIERLAKDEGITIFITTHYMDEADTLCDRVAIIDNGRIVAIGSPRELKDRVGGDIILINLEGDSFGIEEVLEGLPFVKEAKLEGGECKVKVEGGEEAMPKIFETLRNADVGIRSASIIKPSLDQVFLNYTGRLLRDRGESREEVAKRMAIIRRLRG